MAAPQPRQNFHEAEIAAPQPGQRLRSSAPQSPQNFFPAGLSEPQLAQRINHRATGAREVLRFAYKKTAPLIAGIAKTWRLGAPCPSELAAGKGRLDAGNAVAQKATETSALLDNGNVDATLSGAGTVG